MKHRTQLYLDQEQYRWLKRRAGRGDGSIAAVVRQLVDDARSQPAERTDDPLIAHLLEDPPAEGIEGTSVTTLDKDLYGS